MSAGAFSDEKVIEASQRIACIFVDCAWGKKNEDLSQRFNVRGYPTVVFCDPDGKSVGELGDREPAAVAKQILGLADKYSSKPGAEAPASKLTGSSFAAALKEARRTSKLIAYYFYDDSPPSLAVTRALSDDLLKSAQGKFILVLALYRKGSDECVKFDVTRSPTILILEASREKPEEKLLARITGSRTARELARDLESALALAGKESSPTAKPTDAPSAPREPEEKLSDDEIDRKFIRARVAAAMEAVKTGKKAKAIEILEDLVKSYPKHVDTPVVKKLLEETRK